MRINDTTALGIKSGNLRNATLIIGLLLFSSLAWAQFPTSLGGTQLPASPSGTSGTYGDQTGNSTSAGASENTLPNCSVAQAGQACIKDTTTGGSSVSTGPVISSAPDDVDGTIEPSGAANEQIDNRPNAEMQGQTDTQNQPLLTDAQQSQVGATPGKPNQTQSNRAQSKKASLPQSQFQRFVTTSIGKKLPLFGYDLFDKVPSTFAPLDQIPVTADYVIGPGDQLVVRAWGQIDINYKATVDRNGLIYLPRVGDIRVAGVRSADLPQYLRTQIGRVFRNFDLDVTLGRLRSIPVFVVGQAQRPGGYTISSLSTLVNAIFVSGGPSIRGSMRHIQLKRNDQIITDFDLYDLLLKGDKSKDAALLPGDVIYFPPVGAQVAITGSINTPAIYELRGETLLDGLITLAGGLSSTAEGQRVILERIDERIVRHMEQFNLDPTGLGRPLKDGDLVTVFPLKPRFDNAIVLRGNVAVPGRYPWHEGMRVSDLIPSRNALLTPDYFLRLNSAASASTSGQEQLRNDIERTAPEINWDYAVVQRMNPDTLTSTLIPFNLGNAVDKASESDLALRPGDVVTVFSQADIRVPIQQQSKYVRLEGELTTAGVYKANAGESLRDLVTRVGGLTPNAYLYGAQLTRESTRIEQQARLNEISERFSQDVERSAAVKSQNLTNPAEAVTLQSKVESQRRLAERLKLVKATGRIVLNVRPTDVSLKALPDLTLEDGDRLVVPYRPSTVSVLGAVYDQADFVYRPGRRLSDYLREAGGSTRTGDKRKIYIIRANGSVRGSEGSNLFRGGIMGEQLFPGDTIVVPEQINKTTLIKNLLDYSQILSQFGLGVAAIKVLVPSL